MFELAMILWAVVRVRRGRVRVAAGGCEERVLLVPERDLGQVTGDMNAAYILRRVRDWVASNERLRKSAYALNGEYWCVQSYRQWTQDVTWLSERQVARLIRDLETRGLLVSVRWRNGGAKGYRVDEAALQAALDALTPAPSPTGRGETPERERVGRIGETPSPKRETPIRKASIKSNKKSKNQSGEESNQTSSPPATPMIDFKPKELRSKNDKGDPAAGLVARYGSALVASALDKAQRFGAGNPYAYAATVLRREEEANGLRPTAFSQYRRAAGDGVASEVTNRDRYVSGKYADFIDS